MRITIRHTNLETSAALQDHVDDKVNAALHSFVDRVGHVTVRIIDENGPRGGIDTRCRIVVALAGGQEIIVQGDATDAYDAVTYAAARLHVRMARAHGRRVRTRAAMVADAT